MERHLAVIGGSGLYHIPGLTGAEWRAVSGPWGAPSDEILTGRLGDMAFSFLPRHGRGHVHSPTTVPYRANIDALKRLGVTDIVSVSACGSFREDMSPGDFVLVDQFIDRTFAREKSFFGAGCVAHVSLAKPTCADLRAACLSAARTAEVPLHDGGTYLAMEGPQFSTIAESRLYRSWGCDVIGMTNMPEAKLAREAEICYASIAMITDFDSWHPGHDTVDIQTILGTLTGNGDKARRIVAALPGSVANRATPCLNRCDTALDHAIMTAPAARDRGLTDRLDAVAGRVL